MKRKLPEGNRRGQTYIQESTKKGNYIKTYKNQQVRMRVIKCYLYSTLPSGGEEWILNTEMNKEQ